MLNSTNSVKLNILSDQEVPLQIKKATEYCGYYDNGFSVIYESARDIDIKDQLSTFNIPPLGTCFIETELQEEMFQQRNVIESNIYYWQKTIQNLQELVWASIDIDDYQCCKNNPRGLSLMLRISISWAEKEQRKNHPEDFTWEEKQMFRPIGVYFNDAIIDNPKWHRRNVYNSMDYLALTVMELNIDPQNLECYNDIELLFSSDFKPEGMKRGYLASIALVAETKQCID